MSDIIEIKLPELGENIEKAEVTRVLVKPGDQIEKDQSILEVESDKAALEVPSPEAGTVKNVHVKEGDSIKVGTVILDLDDSTDEPQAEDSNESNDSNDKKPQSKSETSDQEKKADSDDSRQDSKQESDKEAALDKFDNRRIAGPAEQPEIKDPAPAAPSVRRLARELGVDINRVRGSGPAGRISIEDVKSFVKDTIKSGGRMSGGPARSSMELPDFTQWGEVEREKLSGIRRTIGQRMVTSWNEIPHVTQFDEADILAAENFRNKHQKEAGKMGAKITPTAMLIKITAHALRKFPNFNASLDDANGELILKNYVNIGVAVDTDRGLLVPVIKNADEKGILEIAKELGELAAKARDRKTTPDELQGGNFSITNLGGLGTTYFTPIINWPDVAILGVGRARMQQVYKEHPDGSAGFETGMIMPLSISYDHRIIDGADAARFLRWICESLENPFRALM